MAGDSRNDRKEEQKEPRFAGLQYCDARKCLERADGSIVTLRAQSLAVFRTLAERADRVVSKQELLDEVWGDVLVTDDSLVQCVADIRRALGDADHRVLRTIPRQGYQLVADSELPSEPVPGPVSRRHTALWAASIAAIVIVTWVILGTDRQTRTLDANVTVAAEVPDANVRNEVLADDLDELATRAPAGNSTAQVPSVFVTGGAEEATTLDPRVVAILAATRAALDRYRSVVVYNNSKADFTLRLGLHPDDSSAEPVSVEIVERATTRVLYSATLAMKSEDAAGARETGVRIAALLASPGIGAIDRHLLAGARTKQPDELTRAECYAYGYDCTNCSGELDSITPRAEACLARLLREDPADPDAWALQSTVLVHRYQWGTNMTEPARSDLAARAELPARAMEAALRAEQLSDGGDTSVYWGLAQAYGATCDVPRLREAVRRGLAINPDDPSLLATFGNWIAYAGHWDEGAALIERALEIEPRFFHRWWLFGLAKRHYVRGEYAQALALFDRSFNERNWLSHLQRAYTLPWLGRTAEARQAVAELELVAPGMTIEQALQVYRTYCFTEEYLDRMREGLKMAGLPSRGDSTNIDAIVLPHAQLIDLDGTQFEYIDVGEGIPIVFVHGDVSDYRSWAHYQNLVSEHYRYLAYSRRYYGSQPWPDNGEGFSADTAARDLVALIEKLAKGPVFLVGWSSGAEVVAIVAEKYPDLVDGIVLYEPVIDSIADDDAGALSTAARDALYANFGRAAEQAAAGEPERAAKTFLETAFELPPGGFETEIMPIRKVVLDNARTVPLRLGPQVAGGTFIDCDFLSRVTVPTLVVRGERTNGWWSYLAHRFRDCVPGATLESVPNVRHFLPIRKPRVLFDLIDQFVTRHTVDFAARPLFSSDGNNDHSPRQAVR